MEWISRQLILPFLEEEEEGLGCAVSVEHLAPCRQGARISITAKVHALNGNRITTQCIAERAGKVIGKGMVEQVVLPNKKIDILFNS